MDCSPPGSSVHGISQARLLEWVAISFSRDLPSPGNEPSSPTLQADSLPTEPSGKPQYFFDGGKILRLLSWKERKEVKLLSRVQLSATPWTVAHQAPLPMGFSRQDYWSGLPFPSPGDLPDPGIKPKSPAL